jgi:hypothetical protein
MVYILFCSSGGLVILQSKKEKARQKAGFESGSLYRVVQNGRQSGIVVTSYMLPASVSWWNGDNHLLPFFCQIDVAKTFPACFLPSQVASCVAV